MNRPNFRQHRMTDYELLQACIQSGQVEADQVEAHYVAGDLQESEPTHGLPVSPWLWYGAAVSLSIWAVLGWIFFGGRA